MLVVEEELLKVPSMSSVPERAWTGPDLVRIAWKSLVPEPPDFEESACIDEGAAVGRAAAVEDPRIVDDAEAGAARLPNVASEERSRP